MRAFPLAFTALSLAAAAAEPTKEQADFFENKIRPILADNCYKCHSLEKGKSKGGLTLDTRDGVMKGGEDGPAIKPGNPDDSPLIKAVRYEDKDLQMPPSKDGGKLSETQIAALTQWVKMGAPDPRTEAKASKLTGLTAKAREHWAYQPVTKPAQPAVKNRAWCRTAVDTFILAKIEEKGMLPMPDTSKETLLRRATYDLTGLPPTPQEVQDFMADGSPQAFAKVVERLLASPAYGERWGRYWLDTARYADTIGGDKNNRKLDYRYPFAWTYRDYVIKAFNDDKPYDQFIVEQLAADKLPDIKPDDARMAGLGFLTVGERFNNMNDVINDRIDTMSKGFLAMTVACSRCHDHKFDPIPTKDYYALHGVFASTLEPTDKPVIGMSDPAKLADFEAQYAAVEKENRETYYRVLGEETAKFRANPGAYILTARRKKDKSSEEELKARNELIAKNKLDPQLSQEVARNVRPNDPVFAPFKYFMELDSSDFADRATGVLAEIQNGKGRARNLNPLVVTAFKDAKPQSIQDVADIYAKLFASVDSKAKDYLKAASESKSLPVPGFEPALAQLVEMPFHIEAGGALDTAKLREATQRWPQQMTNRAGFAFSKINELQLTHPGAPKRAMIMADSPNPRNSPVFIRGQQETRGEIVPRHFLEILSPAGQPQPFKQGSGRLELAQCIASKSNPLTARVMVNRVWMHHFGEGFVRTPDDLGTQSEPPSHPELFDFLASYFMESGWSLKKLHRVIMLSHVYQESSDTNKSYEQIDPQNRLLWHSNIRRLDFEAMRDSLLVFSGKLDRTLGGQPINLTDEPYSYRRSVYGYIDRGNLPELMQSFDFSDPDMPNSKRATTIVPQQALFLMNSAMSIDVARRIVARPEFLNARDDLARVIALYRVIFQRNPKPAEIPIAVQFVAGEAKNQPLTAPGQQPVKPGGRPLAANRPVPKKGGRNDATRAIQNEGEMVERKPLTPWETYAQALLFSNEAAYVN
jgi:hypothetical protein